MTDEIAIDAIKIGDRFRKEVGDVRSLAKDIEKTVLLHPVVIDDENNLIAGRRRIDAYKLLGRTTIPYTRVPIKDLRRGEIAENTERKDFTVSELVAIKRYLEPEIKGEAEERRKATGGRPKTGVKFTPVTKPKSRDVVASYAGKSFLTMQKAEKIVEAFEKDPEKYAKTMESVDSGKTSIDHAYADLVRAERHINTPELPEGVFDVIYADPPYSYFNERRGNPSEHYATMSVEDICALRVPSAENAVLFIWVPGSQLVVGMKVLEAWGFKSLSQFVWVKDKIGLGYWVREQHELLLIGRKGDVPPPNEEDRVSSVLSYPRKEHSAKPPEVRDIIRKMLPNRKYLELFARGSPPEGWKYWGIEANTGESRACSDSIPPQADDAISQVSDWNMPKMGSFCNGREGVAPA